MSELRDLVRIEDPTFYLNDPFPIFARMRKEAPVFYYEELDTFVLTKHEDIRFVNRTPELFSNASGIFLNDVKHRKPGAGHISFYSAKAEQIGYTDPPRHRELRNVISPAFTGRVMKSMDSSIRQICAEQLESIVPDQVCDWLETAAIIPIRIASTLVGLPDTDLDQIRHWSDMLERKGAAISREEFELAALQFSSLESYILQQFEAKRARPGDDLLSTLLAAELDNELLSEANVVMFTQSVLAAGSDTTRALLAGMVWALATNPDQMERLVGDRTLVAGTVEEAMRWITPARAFLRTVKADTEIRGQKIRAGQHVYLMYMAANRDEDVFDDPEKFDIGRSNSAMQVSFGYGTHVCIAGPLVRLEAAVVLHQLLDRFSDFELAAPPIPVIHMIRNSWQNMPIVFRR